METNFFFYQIGFCHYFHGKTKKKLSSICKIFVKNDCNKENFDKTLHFLGSNLVFLMFRFFPLNLDRNPENKEGK